MSADTLVLRCMHSFRAEIYEITLSGNSVVHFLLDRSSVKVLLEPRRRLSVPSLIGCLHVHSQPSRLLLEPLTSVEIERDSVCRTIDSKDSLSELSVEDTIAFDQYEFKAHITSGSFEMPPALPEESSASTHEDDNDMDAVTQASDRSNYPPAHAQIPAYYLDSETEDEDNPRDSGHVTHTASTFRATDSKAASFSQPSSSPTARKSQSQGGAIDTQTSGNALFNMIDSSAPPIVPESEGEDDAKTPQSSSSGKLRMPTKRKILDQKQAARKRTKKVFTTATPDQATESDDELTSATATVEKKKALRLSLGKSTASTPSSTHSSSYLTGAKLKVLLSSCSLDKKLESWLKRQIEFIQEVPGKKTRYVCVVPKKKVSTTPKVLKSLLANKLVVSETWFYKSKEAGELLEPQDYIHPALVGTLGDDRRRLLFKGMTLFFTNDAKKKYGKFWEETLAMAKQTGSTRVESGSFSKGIDITPKDKVIFFADKEGKDATALMEDGRVVFDTQFLSQSILHGIADVNDVEFQLGAQNEED